MSMTSWDCGGTMNSRRRGGQARQKLPPPPGEKLASLTAGDGRDRLEVPQGSTRESCAPFTRGLFRDWRGDVVNNPLGPQSTRRYSMTLRTAMKTTKPAMMKSASMESPGRCGDVRTRAPPAPGSFAFASPSPGGRGRIGARGPIAIWSRRLFWRAVCRRRTTPLKGGTNSPVLVCRWPSRGGCLPSAYASR